MQNNSPTALGYGTDSSPRGKWRHAVVRCIGRVVSMLELEVTFWQVEHITSLCNSNRKERKKDRLKLAGIKFSVWYWFAVCPSTRKNSRKNSAAHCCCPCWNWLLICGKQVTRAAGRTNPGSVSYNLRKLRVLHTKHIPPKTSCNNGKVTNDKWMLISNRMEISLNYPRK